METLNSPSAIAQPLVAGLTPAISAERQILTFTLGTRAPTVGSTTQGFATDYGIDLADVQKIRGYTPATPIPNTPGYIKGALNLRGAVIPVIDLRIRFGVAKLEYTKFTVIIVVNVSGRTTASPMGSQTSGRFSAPIFSRHPTSVLATPPILSTGLLTLTTTSC